MKRIVILSIVCVSIIFIESSCDKPNNDPERKVQFQLYTDKDFSTDDNLVTFRASIQNTNNQVLWDSVLAPMKIKDIPAFAQKIAFEKIVPGNNPSLLKVGFYYVIENVGNSWHLDSFKVGETFKIVDFNFQ